MKKFYLSGLVFLLSLTLQINAQEIASSSWVAEFSQDVRWQRVTDFGGLIVNTSEALYGLDPQSGERLWEHKSLGNLSESGYQPISGTPFVEVSKGGENQSIYILEPFEGNIVFESGSLGLERLKDKHLLTGSKTILIQGYRIGEKKPSIYMVDLASGKVLWEKHDDFGLLTAVKEVNESDFIISTLWKVYRINCKTGDIVWEMPIDEETAKQLEKMKALGNLMKQMAENFVKPGDVLVEIYDHPTSEDFIMGYEVKQTKTSKDASGKETTTVTYKSGYKSIDSKTGKSLWTENIEFKGQKGVIIFENDGMIVCPNAGTNTWVNKVDYASGTKMWGKKGKGFKVKGGVVNYKRTEAGIVLMMVKDGMSNNSNYSMNLLDPTTGLLKFEKYLKVKGDIERTIVLEKGLFYSTTREANIVNLSDGTVRLPKSIVTGPGMTIPNESHIYVFSPKENQLYSIDRQSLSITPVNKTELKFSGKENPTSLEFLNGHLVVSAMQNVAMVGTDGSIKYNKYFEAPSIPGIMKALNAAMAVRAAYVGMAASYTSAAFGQAAAQSESELGKEVGSAISQGYAELGAQGFSYAGKYLKAINKRFKATASTSEYHFVLTVGDGRKDNRLIFFNKETGEAFKYLSLGKDKEPVYQVDSFENQIYYRKEPNKIYCYSF